MLDPITISSAGTDYRPSATMDWDITHTEVYLSFNFKEKTATGKAVLDMHPYFYNKDVIVLDAKSMKINNVVADGKQVKYNYNNDSLIVHLDRQYHRTENIKLGIDYVAMPYAQPTGGSKAIRDDRGLYFINTDNSVPGKPMQVWTQGETQATSHWVPTFDWPIERFTTTVHLRVPDSLTTLSNGLPGEAIFHDDGTRTDVWHMDKEIQPYVMMMAIGRYDIVADKQWRGIDVNYYVEPEFEPYALEMFKHTPEMMEFFSGVTGVPYAWQKYSQVVVRDFVSGAMENTSATTFGEFINQDNRETADHNYEDVVAHELFHQWFGDYVTAESWPNLTLNESFATYGEHLWNKYKYGEPARQKQALDDLTSYLGQAKNNDPSLVRFHYNQQEDMFDRVSYQKGACILNYLHALAGDSAFYRAMKIYLEDNALQPAEAHNWRMAVEKATGKDWNWFFNQWYFKGGHPQLEVDYNFDNNKQQVKVTITQKQEELYLLPLKVNVVTGSVTKTDSINIDGRNKTLTYTYKDSVKPVIFIDAGHWLVGEITDKKTTEEWLAYYKAAGKDDYRGKITALKNTIKNIGTASVQEMYELAIHDDLEFVRVHALNALQPQKNDKIRGRYRSDIQFLAMQDNSRHVRAAAFNILSKWKVDAAERDMYWALTDDSYLVAAAALDGISNINKDTVYTLAKQLLNNKPRGALLEQIWDVIADEANPDDTVLIKAHKYSVSGSKKLRFAGSMATYMRNTPSDSAFAVALESVEYLVLSENIGVYRTSISSYLFDVAYFFKDEVAAASKKSSVTKANNRLNMLRKSLLKLQENETDENNISTYKKYMADVYGNN